MKKKIIVKILMIVCIIGIIVSLTNIVLWLLDNSENKKIQEELEEYIEEKEENNEKEEYYIDFNSLKEKNSDTVAYLKVNNTNISNIVVKGNDNDYYLKHNFNKNYNRSGWIFMDYRNKFDGSDKNIVIYGHNTADGSMFGTLRKVITKEWYLNKENYVITLFSKDKKLEYQVFSTYSINVEDYYIKTNFENNTEFNKFVNTLRNRSVYNYNVMVDGNSHILTLSTCTSNGKRRMVLHAKLVNEEKVF